MIKFVTGFTLMGMLVLAWVFAQGMQDEYFQGYLANIAILGFCIKFYFLGKIRILS